VLVGQGAQQHDGVQIDVRVEERQGGAGQQHGAESRGRMSCRCGWGWRPVRQSCGTGTTLGRCSTVLRG
jgi:hypothetical protein